MESYVFCGVILPERAQLSRQYALEFLHRGSGAPGKMKVSILNNQLFVWVETDREWDICDLRNVVNTIVQGDLAVIGYLKGYAYDLSDTGSESEARS